MPKRTHQFQQLIHSIHLQLYHDAKVTESKIHRDSANGRAREVDIVIEIETPLYPMIIGVECIGRGRKATIEWVEQMLKKHENLTNRLVLVYQAGFTPGATQMAKENGVEVLTLADAVKADWTKVVGKLSQVNIVLPQIDVTHVALSPPLDASHLDVLSLPFYTNNGDLLCNLLEIVDMSRRAPSVLDYIVQNCKSLFCNTGSESPLSAE